MKSQTLLMAGPDDESASTRVDREPRRLDGEHPTDEVGRDDTPRRNNSTVGPNALILDASDPFEHEGDMYGPMLRSVELL